MMYNKKDKKLFIMLILDIICFLFLLYFAYQDIKTRYIDDRIAIILIIIGTIYILLTNPSYLIIPILISVFGFITYYTGMLGGGDTEVLLFLSLFMPYFIKIGQIKIPFVFLVFILATLLSAITLPIIYLFKIKKYVEIGISIILSLILFYFNFLLGLTFLIFSLFLFYFINKEEIQKKFFVKEKEVDKLDFEEILALEYDPNLKKYTNKRVHLPNEIENLKKKLKQNGINKVLVFEHLPPFVPFILLATIILYFLFLL